MGVSGGLPGLKHTGKLVAKPSDALPFLLTAISFHRTGKLSTNAAKIPGGVVGGGTGGQLHQHPPPSSDQYTHCHVQNKTKKPPKTETFRKHPLGDPSSIIRAG